MLVNNLIYICTTEPKISARLAVPLISKELFNTLASFRDGMTEDITYEKFIEESNEEAWKEFNQLKSWYCDI